MKDPNTIRSTAASRVPVEGGQQDWETSTVFHLPKRETVPRHPTSVEGKLAQRLSRGAFPRARPVLPGFRYPE